MKLRIRQEYIILIIILLAGTALRTFNLKEIPLTHDELSVVFRSGYDSFRQLIEEGVKPDVHPAGIQVFMNYWVGLAGDSPAAVKFPFILAGILSIFLVWKLGREWFGTDTALVSAAFTAALEYFVMHSQTARPYASGLMFSLLMVYAWQRYLFKPGKRPYAWLATYILASAACAYNHYFSMMFAGVVGVTGLIFLKRSQIIPYLLACLAILLLFTPHLKIFFFQFQEKGVEGWLGKPDNDFIIEYISYAFHFSPWVLSIVAGIILAGIIMDKTRNHLRNRFFIISLAWFFIPFLVAFFYSRYVAAVLQLRVMIFFFPFLLFAFTGIIPSLKKPLRIALPIFILVVVSLSLILERRYYDLYYHSRFREIIVETDRSLEEYSTDNCLAIIDSHEKISEYYYERLGIRFDHHRMDNFDRKADFTDLLQKSKTRYLSMGVDSHSDFALPGIILDHYPFLVKKLDYVGGNYYLFSRETPDHTAYRQVLKNDFEIPDARWSPGIDSLYTPGTGWHSSTSYTFTNQHEFGPSFTIPLQEIAFHKNDLIDVSVSVRNLDSLNNAHLVLSLSGKKGLIEWTSAFFSDYDPHTGEYYTVYQSFRPGKNLKNRNLEVQVYVWNKDKNRFMIDNFRVRVRPGNPVLYGLTQKL